MIDSLKFFGDAFVNGIRRAPGDIFRLILLWIPRLWELLCDLLRAIRNCKARRGRRFKRDDCCVQLPPDTLVRPDPLIYSQSYLMAQGLAVMWDNPDIEIYQIVGGMPPQFVPSHKLKKNTEYEVRVRVWNGSYDAPAPGLPVHLSFLTFGINTVSTPISDEAVNLPVKGAPNHPVIVPFKWKTPDAPGHYCLQASLEWPDDANPDNNLGQENVDVGVFASPAIFEFPIRNERRYDRRFNLTVDTYQLPALLPCDEYRPGRSQRAPQTRLQESTDRWKIARALHARDAFPVPPGWSVEILPGDVIDLAPLEERLITVRITAPAGFTGKKAFNVNAFERGQLIGGVTLQVETK